MAPIFPLLKMAVLFTTRIARPFNVIIMRSSKRSKLLTRYIIMPPAQFYHWWDVRWRMQTLDLRTPHKVRRLSDVEATELGAAIWAEGMVFTIGSAFLVSELYKQNSAAVRKREEEAEKAMETEHRLQTLEELVNQQTLLLQELTNKRIQLRKTGKPRSPGTAMSTSKITTTFYSDQDSPENQRGLLTRMIQALGNHI